jgi:hypothetical protein
MLKDGIPLELVKDVKLLKGRHSKQEKVKSAENARASKPDAKAKEAFQKWVIRAIALTTHSGEIQIGDVRGMTGFEASWGQNDATLKRWLKEAVLTFSFKRGAKKRYCMLPCSTVCRRS